MFIEFIRSEIAFSENWQICTGKCLKFYLKINVCRAFVFISTLWWADEFLSVLNFHCIKNCFFLSIAMTEVHCLNQIQLSLVYQFDYFVFQSIQWPEITSQICVLPKQNNRVAGDISQALNCPHFDISWLRIGIKTRRR